MGSIKRLRSVVHNIADHAISELSCVHPHLGTDRKAVAADQVSVDLLHPEVSALLEPLSAEIELFTSALRKTLAGMLASESWETGDLTSAVITFIYRGQCTWPHACYVRVQTKTGKTLEDAVGADGVIGQRS